MKGLPWIRIKLLALLWVAVTAFPSCEHHPNATPKYTLPDTVFFSKHIIPLFNSHCSVSGCHTGSSPTANLNLSQNVAYSQLFAKSEVDTIHPEISVLYIQMNSTSNPMPKSGRLSDYDVNLVLKWIQQKAKNN